MRTTMLVRFVIPGIAALTLAFATMLTGCGGDDDAASDSGGDAASTAKNGDDKKDDDKKDDGKTSDAGPVSGTDKEYVKDVCVGFNTYMDSVFKVIQGDPSATSDQAVLVKKLGPLLEAFAKDVSKANPPKDVKKYHDQLVKQVKDSSEKLKSGKVTSLAELSEGVTPPKGLDPSIVARLSSAEKQVKECSEGQLAGIGGLFSAGT